MVPGIKYLYALAALVVIYITGFLVGFNYGKSKVEQTYSQATSGFFLKWTGIVADLSSAFADIAAKAEKEKAEVRVVIREVIKEGTDHVEATEQSYLADPVLINLRLCAYDSLYRATGTPLPPERLGAACPATVPLEH